MINVPVTENVKNG